MVNAYMHGIIFFQMIFFMFAYYLTSYFGNSSFGLPLYYFLGEVHERVKIVVFVSENITTWISLFAPGQTNGTEGYINFKLCRDWVQNSGS